MLSEYKKQLNRKGEVYLQIKAKPGASKTQVKEIMADNSIKIFVAAEPVKGKANQELIKFLSREFDVAKNSVKIIGGAGDRVKLVKIEKN